MKKLFFIPLLVLVMFACQGDKKASGAEKSLTEYKPKDPNSPSSIIRNPVSAKGIQDTINVAKMFFAEPTFYYDTVREGTIIEHDFSFTNKGKIPLLISSAHSTCGCTVPKWPKEPIAPGETGSINVRFDTKGKKNIQNKPVIITANTYPNTTKVYVSGFVKPK